jgi:uncharacterized protein (UPF0335 family)
MNWFEESFVLNNVSIHKPTFWKRFRDDIFLVWDFGDSELNAFLNHLNKQEPKIQFTMELEKENQLPFLDLLIKRTEHGLITNIYPKPTHTQSYIYWRSNHPKNILLGTLKGLIHRAHKLIDEKEDLLNEIQLLEDVFVSNGYPEKLVKQTVKESWETELLKAIKTEQNAGHGKNKNSEFFDVLHAPYVQGFSEILQRMLKKVNVGFVPETRTDLRTLVCNLKPKIPPEKAKNVIYGIKCSTCGLWYIGETSQRFETRRKQHQGAVRRGDKRNAFACHLEKFPDHSINWNDIVFFGSEIFWDKRKIHESILINAINPADSISALLNIEKGKQIENCWLEFGEEIRTSLSPILDPNK